MASNSVRLAHLCRRRSRCRPCWSSGATGARPATEQCRTVDARAGHRRRVRACRPPATAAPTSVMRRRGASTPAMAAGTFLTDEFVFRLARQRRRLLPRLLDRGDRDTRWYGDRHVVADAESSSAATSIFAKPSSGLSRRAAALVFRRRAAHRAAVSRRARTLTATTAGARRSTARRHRRASRTALWRRGCGYSLRRELRSSEVVDHPRPVNVAAQRIGTPDVRQRERHACVRPGR